jgi:hypothetical protein
MDYIDKLLTTNEKVLVRQRSHWAALLGVALGFVWQMVLLAMLVYAYRSLMSGDGLLMQIPGARELQPELRRALLALPDWVLPLLAVLYIVSAIYTLAMTLLRWLNSINLVTNRRVMHVRGILSKTTIDSSLEKVNDVLLNQPLLGRILGYGHLVIMTASETGLNAMPYLPDPMGFKRALMDAKQAMVGGATIPVMTAPAQTQGGTVAQRMAELQKLKDLGLITPAEFETKRKKLLDEV